jgi:hypothetical protein
VRSLARGAPCTILRWSSESVEALGGRETSTMPDWSGPPSALS